MVGHKIHNGEIGLVPDPGDDGNRSRGHHAGHPLIIESPQVFDGTTPSGQEDHINILALINPVKGLNDGGWGIRTLDQAGDKEHIGQRPTGAQHAQDIAQRRTCGRGDDSNAPGQKRQRPFAGFFEQTFGLELAFERFEAAVQFPHTPGRFHGSDDKLQHSPGSVKIQVPLGHDLLSLSRDFHQ